MLTGELANANETIEWLSSLTGQNPSVVRRNVNGSGQVPSSAGRPSHGNYMDRGGSPPKALQRQDSAVTNRNSNAGLGGIGAQGISVEQAAEIERVNANRVGTAVTAGGTSNNAANETKDAITGRIIHTVNMMKEVLQGNLGLRETIQK